MAGGAGLQPIDLPGLTQLTADMMDEGTTTRTAAQIAIAAEAMGASVSASCGWDGTYVGFKCLADDLGATLDLAADILINPTFPEVEWQRVHGQTLAALQAEKDSAESRAYRALLQALYGPRHLYRFPLRGDRRKRPLDHGRGLEGLPRELSGTRQAAIIVAGDVVPETLADELDRRLAAWRGPDVTLPQVPAAELAPRPRVLVLDRPGAPQAVVRAGHRGIDRLDPAFDHMLLFNQVLGGQFTSRLNAKLARGTRVYLRGPQ